MPTFKTKHSDGHHCFYCNARVEPDASECPGCGRAFAEPDDAEPRPERELGARVRASVRARRRSYRLTLIVLLVAVVVMCAILFRSRPKRGPVLPKPPAAAPALSVIETRDLSARGVQRLSVAVLVRAGLPDDSLRAALDQVFFSTLDSCNRREGRRVQVVWAYLLTDSAAAKSDWRAMAIWADPALPEARQPSGIGGDAVHIGPAEYDFTNPVVPLADSMAEPRGGS